MHKNNLHWVLDYGENQLWIMVGNARKADAGVSHRDALAIEGKERIGEIALRVAVHKARLLSCGKIYIPLVNFRVVVGDAANGYDPASPLLYIG